MGWLWLRELANRMMQGDFQHIKTPEAVRSYQEMSTEVVKLHKRKDGPDALHYARQDGSPRRFATTILEG